ncbi:MAG TPA: GAF domain-containing protein, partial [Chloroflexia bacterium]|nr:GAF domain-containing protein [Chloroflexia bacterium]
AGAPYLEAIARRAEPGVSALPRLVAVLPPLDSPNGPQTLTYQEQQRLAAHMQSLYQISRGFSAVVDEAGIVVAAAHLARDHVGAEDLYLLERQDAAGVPISPVLGWAQRPASLMARWGWQEDREFQPFRIPTHALLGSGESPLQADQLVAIPDLPAAIDPALLPLVQAHGWRSGIVIPLHAAGQALGILALGYETSYRTFTDHDLELADALGAVVARALAGLQLQRAEHRLRDQIGALETSNAVLARRSRDLAALNQTAQSLATLLDVDALCQRIVEALARSFGYTLVSVALAEEGGLRFRAWTGYEQVPSEIAWPLTDGIAGRVMRTGRPALVADVAGDPDYVPLGSGIRSEVCVPLLGRTGVLGVVNIESSAAEPLDEDDLQLLTTLAPQIVVALENARLYAAAQQQTTQLALINRVAQSMTCMVDEDVDTLLVSAAALLQRELGYANVSIMLIDPPSGDLVCHASAGEYADVIMVGYRQPGGVGLIGWVATHGRTLVANDVAAEPRFYQVAPEETPGAEVVAPLIHQGTIIGVLDVESTTRDSFQASDVQMLETLADQLAVALAQARLVEELRQRAALSGV